MGILGSWAIRSKPLTYNLHGHGSQEVIVMCKSSTTGSTALSRSLFELERILLLYLDYLAREAKFNMETRLFAVPRDFVIEVMKP
jgi:hypothetical protein